MSLQRRMLALVALALILATCLPVAASAAPRARMSATFRPERLGKATTISFGFQIGTPGQAPTALRGVSIAYPRNLGFATSGLGVAPCQPAVLETQGPPACPPNSLMGSGSAQIELQIGPILVQEKVGLTLLAGPSADGYLHLLLYASGAYPVEAIVVANAVLLPGRLSITVPPIPSLPEAPYVSLAQLRMTLGGNLTYYETVRGQSVPYHPAGVGLPLTCPRGGFSFAATFAFLDGSHSRADTAVPCPPARPRARHR
jgi:hypothetical protein